MSKHTPGPWHYAECQMGTPYIDTESVGDLFAAVLPLDEEKANTRLMAAALDLLAACEAVTADANDPLFQAAGCLPSETYEAVRAAIAKAKGEK